MGRIDRLIAQIEQLSAEDRSRLAAWFEAFEDRAFDERIERDAKAGKLDEIAERARQEHAQGRSREL